MNLELTDTLNVSNLYSNTTRPTHGVTPVFNSEGQTIAVNVKRSSYTLHYHRTSRGIHELFNPRKGELRAFFKHPDVFTEYAEGKIILDLGCGDGNLVRDLQKQTIFIFGVDLYLNDEQKKSSFFVEGDAFRLGFKSDSFDSILSTFSVFHYEPLFQIRALLTEAKRVLKPRGRLYLAEVQDPDRCEQIFKVAQNLGFKLRFDPITKAIELTRF